MMNVKEIAQDAAISQVARKQAAALQESVASGAEKSTPNLPQPGQDVIEVDQRRRDDAILEENAKLLLKELPDVRPDRVEEARRKLQEGFYDHPEVLEKTAEKVQQDRAQNLTLSADRESNKKQVETANPRLAQGYYEQPEILDETARRIVKKQL